MKERISQIIEYSNLSLSEFADEIDVLRSSISHITSGRNKPSLDFLIKVKNRFPELEWDWLIYGEGEMTKKEKESSTTPPPDLFTLIDDDNFGKEITDESPTNENTREFPIHIKDTKILKINDSQRLENKQEETIVKTTENQVDKVKRVVLFYESGKFESFEP